MIYLRDNALLCEPLKVEHVKQRLLGHWGASPGLSFVYVHLNRLIRKYDLDAIFLAGPGHGAPGVLAPVYLEGSYSEIYPNKSPDAAGMLELFREFSFPGGIGSHCTPDTIGATAPERPACAIAATRPWRSYPNPTTWPSTACHASRPARS